MIHNNKVYANADEKFVKKTIVYTNSDNVLFHDAEFTNPIMIDELEGIFLNGAVISIENGYFAPVFYKISSNGKYGVECSDTVFYTATAPTEE